MVHASFFQMLVINLILSIIYSFEKDGSGLHHQTYHKRIAGLELPLIRKTVLFQL